jgi:ATP-dependent DNA helicase RecG
MPKNDASAAHLQHLLEAGRTPEIHWFPEDVPRGSLAETFVAMANSNGGEVLVGISPRGRQLQGIQNPEALMDKVFQAALDIEPSLVLPLPKLILCQGKPVLWILIPAGLPNIYSLAGRYYGREHTRNELLSAGRLRKLLVERGVINFESRLPEDAKLEDLERAQIEHYLQLIDLPLDTPPETLLVQRGCLKLDDGRYIPTYAGLLLFGKSPQQWLPTATILGVRFRGETFSDRFIKQEITGSLPKQLQDASAFLSDQLVREVQITGLTHTNVWAYPFDVVRELLVNAVAHRDYNQQGDSIHINLFSDRMEIHSPGVLPGPVTLENLLQARFSRNPVIMQILSDLGFGERIGYGLDRAVTVLRDQGFPPPEFAEVAGSFRVTLHQPRTGTSRPSFMDQLMPLELNERQHAVIGYLVENRRVTNREYQEICPEVHPETLRRDLADLVQKNVLLKIGDKRATYYVLKRSLG